MNVRVKLHGALSGWKPGQSRSLDLALHGSVTAGDLLRVIAQRCRLQVCDGIDSSDSRLPRHIRIFSDGEMLSTLDQPLTTASAQDASVNVVVLSPMMGG